MVVEPPMKQLLVGCAPTVQIGERCHQQLRQTGSPRLPRAGLLALEVRGLLVLQLQFHQLQHQGLLPDCPLGWWPSFGGRPQVWDGEPEPQCGVGGEQGEGGAEFSALRLKGQRARKI